MRSHARVWFIALLTAVLLAAFAPVAAQAAGFGVEKFFAANCGKGGETKAEAEKFEKCGEVAKENTTTKEAEEEGYNVAGGHPPFGVTDFVIAHHEQTEPIPAQLPNESVQNLRTDVAPGVVTNPETVTKCSLKDFESTLVEPAHGFYLESKCPASSLIGENTVVLAVPVGESKGAPFYANVTLKGKVYNLEQPYGLASDFGVALDVKALAKGAPVFAHTYIEGSVEWLSDYHDYFTIKNITPGLISSRLAFYGRSGTTGFLRNPSACTKGSSPETTTTVSMESYGHATASKSYAPPVGTEKCKEEAFGPTFELKPELPAKADAADGITAELSQSHPAKASETDSSDLQNASLTLPPGLTINPSAAAGLEGCTPAQIGLEPVSPNVTCPGGSRIGTVELEVPTLPRQSLTGPIYVGKPAVGPIEKPPYTIYLDAESARYGVKVRLKGTVTPNPETGQLTTTFLENPRAPFNNVVVHFRGGAFAPLANPLECGTAKSELTLLGYSGATSSPLSAFPVEGCTGTPPVLAPVQSAASEPPTAGSGATFAINLDRPEGDQYVAGVRTVLPPGVVGAIPAVSQCGEAEANAGTCSASSQIGTVAVAAGSGSPYTFTGKVYFTGPFEGAPYGLSIVVSPVAGPFKLKNVIARVRIEVDPHTAQVIATDAKVPTIVEGIPIRMRSLTITVNRQGFQRNPTNCAELFTTSTVTGTLGASATVKSPFQAEGCASLAFGPSLSAVTDARSSRLNGTSLETTITQAPGQANIKSVLVTLPKQLPSRLTTLQKACLSAVFDANPKACPAGSVVGSARANTPLLPGKLQGLAYFVSHGGAAFPDLDLVLEANGIRQILVGNTNIKNGITTTNFATSPDVPVTSVTVSLPSGPGSAVGVFGSLCSSPLYMPTVITGQNGKQVTQKTKIKVKNCGVQIVGHKVVGNTAYLTIKTFAAGRISGGGSGVFGASRSFSSAQNAVSLKLRLSGSRGRRFHTKLRVRFTPRNRSLGTSTAFVTVSFR